MDCLPILSHLHSAKDWVAVFVNSCSHALAQKFRYSLNLISVLEHKSNLVLSLAPGQALCTALLWAEKRDNQGTFKAVGLVAGLHSNDLLVIVISTSKKRVAMLAMDSHSI